MSRDRATREETGVHPSQSEREASPCTEVSASRTAGGPAPAQSVKSSPPRAMPSRPERKQKSPERKQKKRGRSSSSESSVPRKKEEKKRGRQVVINISGWVVRPV